MPHLFARGRWTARRLRVVLLALVGVLSLNLLAGCGQNGSKGTQGGKNAGQGHVATARAMTAEEISALQPPGPEPAWVHQALAKDVPDLYQWALAHRGDLQYIPCYCGCGQPPHGHMSNADCYFRVQGDQLVWEQHAVG